MFGKTLKVRLYGDPCLRRKSSLVKEVGPSERMLIEAMLATMYENKGIGLAAPQVGINQQIFVVDIGDGPFVVVNPKIMRRSGPSVLEEGCLSIPGVVVKIKRPHTIRVRYLDEKNQPVEREVTDLLARVFLHETDHLLGKIIVDYASWRTKPGIDKQLQEIIKQGQMSRL